MATGCLTSLQTPREYTDPGDKIASRSGLHASRNCQDRSSGRSELCCRSHAEQYRAELDALIEAREVLDLGKETLEEEQALEVRRLALLAEKGALSEAGRQGWPDEEHWRHFAVTAPAVYSTPSRILSCLTPPTGSGNRCAVRCEGIAAAPGPARSCCAGWRYGRGACGCPPRTPGPRRA
jgi:hypothetical protein